MQNKSPELEVAIKAALEAGKILEKYFDTEIEHSYKEDKTIVTKADGEAEEVIKKIISASFPDHSILGEETGHTKNSSEYTWHVDPLDGTKMFARGIPNFGVCIALERNNNLLLGVTYLPPSKSLYYAEKGKGAYLNDKKISVSKNEREKSIITIASPKKDEDLRRNLYRSLPKIIASTRDFGCTALDLSYVARGAIDADIQLGLRSYDFASGAILVLEAGGTITNLDGSPWQFPENYFIASNGIIHEKLIEEIQKIQKQ